MPPICIVSAVISNASGQVLLVRKRGTSIFIQPGGKIERGEEPLAALARELDEELGVRLDMASTVRLGRFEEYAVHEPGRRVRSVAFRCTVDGAPVPQAEIDELAWVDPTGPRHVAVAPLSARHILPAYVQSVAGAIRN
ncbi:MAG TPA: NUDIX domain-containing protein [Oleiagrimonas sp.]|nr:NUDIX domain-containing protein [Oleiagrimonas sp.]